MRDDKQDICLRKSGANAHSFLANLHVAGRKHSQRERIYVSLMEQGPATCEELSLRLRIRYTACSARLSELKAMRFVAPSGEERKTTGGEMASVMRFVSEMERDALLHPKRGYRTAQASLFV